MNHQEIANQLMEHLGGKENVISAAHCATRLRLVIDDEEQINKKEIEELDGVKGAFSSSGQFQVIFGTGTVNKVFIELAPLLGLEENNNEERPKESHSDAAKKKMNPLARFARTLSNIFVPIIPAIVAAGMLMGLLGLMNTYNWVNADSGLFVLLDMFSSAAFIILPILIGFSAAKEFGGNQFLGAVIGGIMTHPALLNPWGLSDAVPETLDIFGMSVEMLGYQGTVIPVLLTVYVMSKIEKGLRKVVPNVIDLLLTPFLTVILTGFFALLVIGPLGRGLGNAITTVLDVVYNTAGPIAGLIFGGLYSMIVLTGVHHSFHAIEAEMLVAIGGNYLLPIWAMANVAQGGATLAVFFKTRNKKVKGIALPAAVSAFLGITEPAIFGVNLKYRLPFIGAAIGGALGGAYVVWTQVMANGIGLTGIPMFAIAQDPFNYLIGFVIAISSAFILTLLLGWKED
ncbi:PTS sugar transporter [Alkalihalobacillus alcalophilus ATCC 27647 = CGMCC 1.3604]|uniref:PTS sugar transporter n=1 Tax=Alkalihalobacillus alcalophilus ATCC 27647 = CGMCC 1.3604 TaxID=1218173 RepID=J8TG34_ALKAL|nr:sucrose-specific PTS transporter subunit IIBC [Alkalihalobacillus alcalophilus]AFV25622.1 sucrose transporter [Alkalihalobacillus alcalophilus ATCC 27647 = CGMCC 1.3604]KGA95739.1 PTS system sucrose-specific transporter subuits IIBC [Alkalihalobacillus alcalophilus ATCC 27647 = CGMCC 1.3604]MED1564132.1 sucrose-specific PTS transporter subunit IIBC [Alkalihalobacillus alcalophilus]THG89495.1 PTS sugar transporter [Alkalihalobacillus alcalophilus ATCC 27647 = CGMCC 1.3604]